MDIHVQRCTRKCAASGRELAAGEEYYSLLKAEGAAVQRLDYAVDHWPGESDEAIGWWKSRMPSQQDKKAALAPNDVLLALFRELEDQAKKADMRFVLALLLVQRRVLRQEESRRDEQGAEQITLYCSRDESTHQIAAVMPDEQRTEEIQGELAQLLYAGEE